MIAKKVCIIGLGYIGLPTAALIANKNHAVLGVDINPHIVATINRGEIHIVEPGLESLVNKVVLDHKFKADIAPAASDVFIIAVPTPFKDEHQPDLKFVKAATLAIAPFLQNNNLVILESTSPVGTTEKISEWLQNARPDLTQLFIAYCPERVIPGKALHELIHNDRIIGGINAESTDKAVQFYRTFVQGEVHGTDAKTAELCKLAENSFRDVNIAFANELSLICDKLNINVWELRRLANLHPRVNILQPGAGVGGHCIAVDPWFIVASCPETAKLIKTAREVNNHKPKWVIEKIKEKIQSSSAKVVACLGITFKPDVDDIRESPALEIVHELKNEPGVKLLICDPYVKDLSDFNLVKLEDALLEADIIVFLVGHQEFKAIPKERLAHKTVIDVVGLNNSL